MDNVLKVMVKGLEQELKARLDGKKMNAMAENYPSPAVDAEFFTAAESKIRNTSQSLPNTKHDMEKEAAEGMKQQGADISMPVRWVVMRVRRWTRRA